MDNNKIQLVGAPCGHHGPYTFYKAFKYCKNGKHKILALSEFFFVKIWSDSDLVSIGELQLLWEDKNSDQVLSSLRLYFLPENTPEGRSDDHGEDEVLAISEKVVLRVEDLLTWITEDATWTRGLLPAVWDSGVTVEEPSSPTDTPDDVAVTNDDTSAVPEDNKDSVIPAISTSSDPNSTTAEPTSAPASDEAANSTSGVDLLSLPAVENHICSTLDFRDVIREKQKLLQVQKLEIKQEGEEGGEETEYKTEKGSQKNRGSVVILSYARYCRYRAVLKRLEGLRTPKEGTPSPGWLRGALAVALGGFPVSEPDTHVLFCKDTFDYPDLEGHELLCNHLAPNLKGRRRRKRKKRSPSPESESNESESSLSTYSSAAKNKFCSGVGSGSGASVNNRDGIRSGRRLAPPPRGRRRRPGGSSIAPPLPPGPQRPPSSSSASSSPPPHQHTNPSSPDNGVGGGRTEEERRFLSHLHTFMKHRGSPIERLPHLGFKKIDLFEFYGKVQSSGGYEKVTGRKLWKHIYDELGGHQGNTSAATCTRRHYEKLLLPYERKVRGQEDKPPPAIHRKHSKGDGEAGDTSNEGSSSTEGPPPSRGHRKVETEMDGREQQRRTVSMHTSAVRETVETGASMVAAIMVASGSVSAGSAVGVPRDKENIVPRPNGGLRLEGRDGAVPPPPELVPLPTTGHAALRDLARRAAAASSTGRTLPTSHSYPITMPTRTASYAAATSLRIPVVPSLKRRKLEILREGGLEVTPIPAPPFPPPPSLPSRSSTGRPSVIHHASPPSPHLPMREGMGLPSSQVSITVTPDVNHIIGNSDAMMRGSSSTIHHAQRITLEGGPSPTGLPRVTQSRSIYARSETVYGNPQDGLHLPTRACIPMHPGPSGIEVLDLRTKARPGTPTNIPTMVVSDDDDVIEIDRVCGPDLSQRSADLRRRRPRGVGSGLEITIVDGNENNTELRNARRPTPGRRKSDEIPNGAHAGLVVPMPGRSGAGVVHGIHPSSPLFMNYPALAGNRPPSSESGSPHPNLYVPLLDQAAAFCSALYGGGSGVPTSASLPHPSSIHRSHLSTQVTLPSSSSQLRPSSTVTQRQMQLYKEVLVGGGMNGMVSSLAAASFGSRSVAGLTGDGSASVTPLLAHLPPHPRATPTSK